MINCRQPRATERETFRETVINELLVDGNHPIVEDDDDRTANVRHDGEDVDDDDQSCVR